jgi:hypothetical protein
VQPHSNAVQSSFDEHVAPLPLLPPLLDDGLLDGPPP